ncbi:hypothetical protein MJG53_003002, partial [Ovis ammon polii x Ovis aries]
ELDTNLAALTMASARATAEKIRCQEEVNRTNKTIELANRLVKGLEWEHWYKDVQIAMKHSETLPQHCPQSPSSRRESSSSLIPPRNKTVDETLQHGNRENQPPDG